MMFWVRKVFMTQDKLNRTKRTFPECNGRQDWSEQDEMVNRKARKGRQFSSDEDTPIFKLNSKT